MSVEPRLASRILTPVYEALGRHDTTRFLQALVEFAKPVYSSAMVRQLPALLIACLTLAACSPSGGWFVDEHPEDRIWILNAPAHPIRMEHAEEGVVDFWLECDRHSGTLGVGAILFDLPVSQAELQAEVKGESIERQTRAKLTSAEGSVIADALLSINAMYEAWDMKTLVPANSAPIVALARNGLLDIEVDGVAHGFRMSRAERKVAADFLVACASS